MTFVSAIIGIVATLIAAIFYPAPLQAPSVSRHALPIATSNVSATTPPHNSTVSNSISSSTQSSEVASTSVSDICTGICIPFSFSDYFEGEWNSPDGEVGHLNNYVIDFKELTGEQYQATNSTFDVYVNSTLAGQVGGQAIALRDFSPDGKYFAFRMRSDLGCAGTCQDTALYVVDLTDPTVMYLLVRPDTNSFVGSFAWEGNNSILLNTYVTPTHGSAEHIYLTDPQQWSFDLTNPQSVMRNGILVSQELPTGVSTTTDYCTPNVQQGTGGGVACDDCGGEMLECHTTGEQ